ncbi:unnamed protein product [Pleuronectes platessa]|uniref:Secreted protein n=1 Tax=Pleuronectes platessa TaxID=8262 RepID=A0A9N7Y4I1_PLEPL|nr:unnamed protein product [Pleuronectes platessa]
MLLLLLLLETREAESKQIGRRRWPMRGLGAAAAPFSSANRGWRLAGEGRGCDAARGGVRATEALQSHKRRNPTKSFAQ